MVIPNPRSALGDEVVGIDGDRDMRVLTAGTRTRFGVVVAEEPHDGPERVTASFRRGAELARFVGALRDPKRDFGHRRGVGVELGVEDRPTVERSGQVHV